MNPRAPITSRVCITSSMAVLPAWLSWWCSGDHTRLVMGARGFKSRSGQIFFQTFIQLYIYIYVYIRVIKWLMPLNSAQYTFKCRALNKKIKRIDKILCYSEFRAHALNRQYLMVNKPIKLYIYTRRLLIIKSRAVRF